VVLPSFFEGFGLALTEALENGAEIICSDIPAHREQLQRYECPGQVWLTPARDADALAAEMEKVLIASRRPDWGKRSQSSALERWTWKDAAVAYLESLSALTPTR
jgi:glycosyltransferase involved in cell wall biosynthesis